MKEIIFVRHGETDSNTRGTYLGWTDVELNPKGIFQAECVRQKLEGQEIKMIFSSPLKRAAVTAEIINLSLNAPIKYSDELKERNFGVWDDLSFDEIIKKYPEDYQSWKGDWQNYVVKDGESSVMAYERIKRFSDMLVAGNEEGTYLVVTHLGCIRKFLAYLLNMGLEGSWRFKVDNCGMAKVSVNDEGYSYLTLLNG
jgi:alpha-ribazole phosphatase